jgi:hypothetical protein
LGSTFIHIESRCYTKLYGGTLRAPLVGSRSNPKLHSRTSHHAVGSLPCLSPGSRRSVGSRRSSERHSPALLRAQCSTRLFAALEEDDGRQSRESAPRAFAYHPRFASPSRPASSHPTRSAVGSHLAHAAQESRRLIPRRLCLGYHPAEVLLYVPVSDTVTPVA